MFRVGQGDGTALTWCLARLRPGEIAATIYTALGIDLVLELRDGQDKPYTLCTGKAIGGLVW